MKRLIEAYLASLRERGELDAILPDLLSQLGLNVYSRPMRGSRQYGVDIAASGELDGEAERIYLLTVKSGDLTRQGWNTGPQAVRQSLDEILEVYIPTHLPAEHRGKPISICICIGGEVHQSLRLELSAYEAKRATDAIRFEEWNGGKISAWIEGSFLREDMLPAGQRGSLRKAMAMVDEPDTAYRHFRVFAQGLLTGDLARPHARVTAVRQLHLATWMLFAWARDAENLDAAYRSAELSVLYGWDVCKGAVPGEGKTPVVEVAFVELLQTYLVVCEAYLQENALPHVQALHATSQAVRGNTALDVNLRLFDVLGRLALAGLWSYWITKRIEDAGGDPNIPMKATEEYIAAVQSLIRNNPILHSPVSDDQATDIGIAACLLQIDDGGADFLRWWMREIVVRTSFSFRTHGMYPCILRSYGELLRHPKSGDDEYRKRVTAGSVLYPMVAFWAAQVADIETVSRIEAFRAELLQHCSFQLWYPGADSEQHLYTNGDSHGGVLHLSEIQASDSFLREVRRECGEASFTRQLSAVRRGWLPLVIAACRHYRLPFPLCLLDDDQDGNLAEAADGGAPMTGREASGE